MMLAVCVDNSGGMAFGNRRQSRDMAVYRDLVDECKGYTLYISEYSEKLFENIDCSDVKINISTSLVADNPDGDGCIFAERDRPSLFVDKISKIIIYKWNTDYPYDMQFDIELSAFRLMSMQELSGNSHETITKEVYVRV